MSEEQKRVPIHERQGSDGAMQGSRIPRLLYHVTTPEKAKRYREAGKINGPVRGFSTLAAALLWGLRTRRTVIYRVSGRPMYPMPDHHLPEGTAWWIDADVTDFACVRHFTAAEAPAEFRKRASSPGLLDTNAKDDTPLKVPEGWDKASSPWKDASTLSKSEFSKIMENIHRSCGIRSVYTSEMIITLGVNHQDADGPYFVQVVKHRDGKPAEKNSVEAVESALDILQGVTRQLRTKLHMQPMSIASTPKTEDNLFTKLFSKATAEDGDTVEPIAGDFGIGMCFGHGPRQPVEPTDQATEPAESTPAQEHLAPDIDIASKHDPRTKLSHIVEELGKQQRARQHTKVYLASPYSHAELDVRQRRADHMIKLVGELIKKHPNVFYSPIAAWHYVARATQLPTDWAFWENMDRTFIEWADELWVVMMEGWQDSKGVLAEIEIAKTLGKRIRMVEPGGDVCEEATLLYQPRPIVISLNPMEP